MSGKPRSVDTLREELFKVSLQHPVDIAVQEDDLFRRNRRLILFDMDSTLIQCEVIDELAKIAGVGKQVADITESAMRGTPPLSPLVFVHGSVCYPCSCMVSGAFATPWYQPRLLGGVKFACRVSSHRVGGQFVVLSVSVASL